MAFYDAGKVTRAHGDLNFSNLRQGFGNGSEGAHPYFGVADFLCEACGATVENVGGNCQ